MSRLILAANLRKLRKWWRWTQKDLAEQACLSPMLIANIEKAKADIRISELEKCAKALKVDISSLLDSFTLEVVDKSECERFLRYVHKRDEDECWIWSGAKDKKSGYGKFALNGKVVYPHRIIYAMNAPLAKHWTVDHTCAKRACVNIAHLKAVTYGRNLLERDQRQDE